jgi:hypothetical protein
MIAGVIVGGTISKQVVVRGIGPSLAPAIANFLPNPKLTLYNSSGQIIETNDDWKNDPHSQGVIDAGLDPTNAPNRHHLTLTPGAYTAILPTKCDRGWAGRDL